MIQICQSSKFYKIKVHGGEPIYTISRVDGTLQLKLIPLPSLYMSRRWKKKRSQPPLRRKRRMHALLDAWVSVVNKMFSSSRTKSLEEKTSLGDTADIHMGSLLRLKEVPSQHFQNVLESINMKPCSLISLAGGWTREGEGEGKEGCRSFLCLPISESHACLDHHLECDPPPRIICQESNAKSPKLKIFLRS